jgi:DNA-binding response OmpR family regulator
LGHALRDLLARDKKPAVVFVEDEPLIRMNAVEVLREHGFDVEEAGTAAEARAILARKNGDAGAAVIDIGLPDKPGDDLAAEFRATHPNMAIVIASGARGEKARAHFAGDPLTAFADKPYNVDSLAVLLRKLRTDL